MVRLLWQTALNLWNDAPYWRWSVLGAGAFTVLSLIYLANGPSGGEAPSTASAPRMAPAETPPIPAPDPMSQLRLSDYDEAYAASDKDTSAGHRCEGVTAAFDKLSSDDVLAGRNIRNSTASRIKALHEGQRCHDVLSDSDGHFHALDQALASSNGQMSAEGYQAISEAYTSIDAFDQSRSRYGREEGAIRRAKEAISAYNASEKRLTELSQAVNALQNDQSATAFARASDALRFLTDFDRARLTPDRKPLLDAADRAAATIGQSRARLARLPDLIAAAQSGQDAAAAMRLIAAVSEITPFDEAVALPAQTATVTEARRVSAGLGWSLLHGSLVTLSQAKTEANYRAVEDIYEMLRRAPGGNRTPEELHDMAEGRQAATFLGSSDRRLQALSDAAAAWDKTGFEAKDAILDAIHAITDFDRTRFDSAHQDAWAILKRAETVLRGPEIGLTNSTTGRTQIFVFASSDTPQDHHVVNSLIDALRDAGYWVGDSIKGAALLVKVTVRNVEQPVLNLENGPIATYASSAELDVIARWAANDTVLLDDTIGASSQGDYDAVETRALLNAVSATVARFKKLTARPSP